MLCISRTETESQAGKARRRRPRNGKPLTRFSSTSNTIMRGFLCSNKFTRCILFCARRLGFNILQSENFRSKEQIHFFLLYVCVAFFDKTQKTADVINNTFVNVDSFINQLYLLIHFVKRR